MLLAFVFGVFFLYLGGIQKKYYVANLSRGSRAVNPPTEALANKFRQQPAVV